MVEIFTLVTYYIAPYWWVYLVLLGFFPSLWITHKLYTDLIETPQFLITVKNDI